MMNTAMRLTASARKKETLVESATRLLIYVLLLFGVCERDTQAKRSVKKERCQEKEKPRDDRLHCFDKFISRQ